MFVSQQPLTRKSGQVVFNLLAQKTRQSNMYTYCGIGRELYQSAHIILKWKSSVVKFCMPRSNTYANKKCGRRFSRHGMPPPASNDTGAALGQHGSVWSHDLATLTFDLGGHGACGWCGLSSSTRTPSLKFVGLDVRKIWHTMCVSINGLVDPDLWPYDLETGIRVTSKVGNLPSKFGRARPLCSWIIHSARDGRTDKSNAYCPLVYGGGGI